MNLQLGNVRLQLIWLRDSDSEDGVFHALVLPPTKNSLASVREMKKDTSSIEDSRALKVYSGTRMKTSRYGKF